MKISDQHIILAVTARFLIPFLALYALYVQFHGEYGPGGGFQAGVIMAAVIVLYALVFGLEEVMRAISPYFSRFLAAFGLFLYLGVGVAAMVNGGAYLNYNYLAENDHQGQLIGIILIELGVLFTVTGGLITIFYAIAGRVLPMSDEE